jgi:hypothetical protein
MVVLESWYKKNMRHHFLSNIDPQEASWRMKTLKQRIDEDSLLGQKRTHLAQLQSRNLRQVHSSLQAVHKYLTLQDATLRQTTLDVPNRTVKDVDPASLKHHIKLLQKHFGLAFADVEHGIVLGDIDPKRAGMAMAAVQDAAHFTVLQDGIAKQLLLVQNALSYCNEGGAHRLAKASSILQDAHNEELYHIASLLHQQRVYASWLS